MGEYIEGTKSEIEVSATTVRQVVLAANGGLTKSECARPTGIRFSYGKKKIGNHMLRLLLRVRMSRIRC
jgi:methylaspartate ammonia-lyase